MITKAEFCSCEEANARAEKAEADAAVMREALSDAESTLAAFAVDFTGSVGLEAAQVAQDARAALATNAGAALLEEAGRLREALTAIVDYVAVNELTGPPGWPVAPHKMKEIARAALADTKGGG